MKKLTGIAVALAIAILTGCGSSAASQSQPAVSSETKASSTTASSSAADKSGENIKIGVLQLESHAALDAAYSGFVDQLADAGFVDGQNLTLDFQNAQGEIANCPTIADKLVNDKNDIILAIATPAAQAVANATTDIPILVTAVTDPAAAKLVKSNDMPGTNVTGTSDMNPVEAQMELLNNLVPEAKKVGFLYSSNEANSSIQIELAKAAAVDLGLEYEDFTVSNTNELQSVVQSMVGKVDAVYIPTDNTIAKAMPTVSTIAIENKIPVIVGEKGMVDNGGLASVSIDYYKLGRITGEMAVEILKGEGEPATMPIRYQTEFDLIINDETVKALGIKVPDSISGSVKSADSKPAEDGAEESSSAA